MFCKMTSSISFRLASSTQAATSSSEAVSADVSGFNVNANIFSPCADTSKLNNVQNVLSLSKNGELEVLQDTDASDAAIGSRRGHRIIPCPSPLPRPSTYANAQGSYNYINNQVTDEKGDMHLSKSIQRSTSENASSSNAMTVSLASSDAANVTTTALEVQPSASKFFSEEDEEAAMLLKMDTNAPQLTDGLNLSRVRRVNINKDTAVVPILARNHKLSDLRRSVFSNLEVSSIEEGKEGLHGSSRMPSDDFIAEELLKKELEILPDMQYSGYQNVPIEEFGMAMLLGMGYDPDIHTVKPLELKKRVYQHAGLGADRALEKDLEFLDKVAANARHAATNVSGSDTASTVQQPKKLVVDVVEPAMSNSGASKMCHLGSVIAPSSSQYVSKSDNKSQAIRGADSTSADRSEESSQDAGFSTVPSTWARVGLYVKIASPKCPKFRCKGIIKGIQTIGTKQFCQLDVSAHPQPYEKKNHRMTYRSQSSGRKQELVTVDSRYLETVVSDRTDFAIIVRDPFESKALKASSSSVVGEIVKVAKVDKVKDVVKIIFYDKQKKAYCGSSYSLGLDDVCEYVDT